MLEIDARHRQHLARQIDPDGTLDPRRHHLEEATEAQGGPRRPSIVAAWLAQAGAPVSAVIGARLAFERGRGRAAVPISSS